MNKETKKKSLEHWQLVSVYLVIYDSIAVSMAYFFALLIRFDFAFSRIPYVYLRPWEVFVPVYAVLCVLVFWRLRLYRSIWRFASFTELVRISEATFITTIIHIIGVTFTLHIVERGTEYEVSRMPISYYIFGALLQFLFIIGIRFSYRFILLLRSARAKNNASRIMIVGLNSIIGTT